MGTFLVNFMIYLYANRKKQIKTAVTIDLRYFHFPIFSNELFHRKSCLQLLSLYGSVYMVFCFENNALEPKVHQKTFSCN